ncbi:protein NBR1 homolog [Cucurbita maxima]|uniref:Protein NBR1 homolog n=1 Tax=Cucurbita maxima TaxID=3661 RepID=A0A6J1KJ67_CUCMA|nr:protein NBR1 homolog [Cucurbita maxima]
MESTMVIKVKYGEMLRRFSVRAHGNNKLDLDINGLRAKILNLFNFSSDTDFTLTYIDEDGDVVTLVNDDDLHEMMRQQLKFWKIDVHLRNKENDQSHNRSDGSSTPMMSASGQRLFQNVRPGISEVLKSLPEPLPEFCSKVFLDIASKAAVASPVFSDLAQSFIRLGSTHPNTGSQASSVPETCTQNVVTEGSTGSLGADSKASKNDGFHQKADSKASRNDDVQCAGLAYKDRKVINSESMTKNIGIAGPAVDLNALPCDSIASGFAIEKSATAAPSSSPFDGKEEEKRNEMHVRGLPASVHTKPHNSPSTDRDGRFVNECPFSGLPAATEPSMLGTAGIDPVNSGYIESAGSKFHKGPNVSSSGYIEPLHEDPIISSRGYVEPVRSIFHRGVICDGCGAHPITGPRFKSQVKDNYDLCMVCFAEMGNEADYIRIDRPVSYWRPRMKSCYRRPPFPGPKIINALISSGKQTKLDSRFVDDINVLDGTVMPPCTPFTKIWRLYNSGSVNWPRGTQLVWTGGDNFSRSESVELEVPADGLPPGREIDIAVDFIAPPFSGQYTSYWIMASPSGQKFGQRVWVLIQVDAALGMPDSEHSRALDSNLSSSIVIGSAGSNSHEGVEKNATPAISDGVLLPRNFISITELVKPDLNVPISETELQFLVNEDMLVGKSPDTSAPSISDGVLLPPRNFISITELVKPDLNVPISETELQFLVNEDMLVGKSPDTSAPSISDGVLLPPRNFISITELVKPDLNVPISETELQFLVNEDMLVGKSPDTSATEDNLVSSRPAVDGHGVLPRSTEVPSVSYPLIDLSVPTPAANPPPPIPSPKVSPASSEKVTTNNVVEENLLKTLQDMGFKQVDLNKEVLKRNEYNLEHSVDELCGVSEWDPMLDELEEMGFIDKETNKRLLMKNNGSMKRVVMELLYGEKA